MADKKDILDFIKNSTQISEDQKAELYLYSIKKMADENMEKSRTDLTNLLNLKAFYYQAAENMQKYADKTFAVITLDICNFKAVNDFCGRAAGDELLLMIADCFRSYESDDTAAAHFRADIFALCIPFQDKQELGAIAEDIYEKIIAFPLSCKVLPSFGICIASDSLMPINIMCDYANMALKTIKGKVFITHAFFDDAMHRQMLLEKQIENDMVDALRNHQFQVYIQPKVDMHTKRIVGGEALVRWNHPVKGIITPDSFLPIFEKNGFIIDMDIYIWSEVFKTIRSWVDAGYSPVPISINVSRIHAYDKAFQETLYSIAQKYHIPPKYVSLELTESAYLENAETLFHNMKSMQNNGFSFSMDDFGSGYSSMKMLKTQPLDEIKMDRWFLSDITSEKSRIIVRHTIDMIHELGIDMIAEGVETEEQCHFLMECGCYKGQGFLFFQPMPIAEFEKLLILQNSR